MKNSLENSAAFKSCEDYRKRIAETRRSIQILKTELQHHQGNQDTSSIIRYVKDVSLLPFTLSGLTGNIIAVLDLIRFISKTTRLADVVDRRSRLQRRLEDSLWLLSLLLFITNPELHIPWKIAAVGFSTALKIYSLYYGRKEMELNEIVANLQFSLANLEIELAMSQQWLDMEAEKVLTR